MVFYRLILFHMMPHLGGVALILFLHYQLINLSLIVAVMYTMYLLDFSNYKCKYNDTLTYIFAIAYTNTKCRIMFNASKHSHFLLEICSCSIREIFLLLNMNRFQKRKSFTKIRMI